MLNFRQEIDDQGKSFAAYKNLSESLKSFAWNMHENLKPKKFSDFMALVAKQGKWKQVNTLENKLKIGLKLQFSQIFLRNQFAFTYWNYAIFINYNISCFEKSMQNILKKEKGNSNT